MCQDNSGKWSKVVVLSTTPARGGGSLELHSWHCSRQAWVAQGQRAGARIPSPPKAAPPWGPHAPSLTVTPSPTRLSNKNFPGRPPSQRPEHDGRMCLGIGRGVKRNGDAFCGARSRTPNLPIALMTAAGPSWGSVCSGGRRGGGGIMGAAPCVRSAEGLTRSIEGPTVR